MLQMEMSTGDVITCYSA